jgi:hypothetical protein
MNFQGLFRKMSWLCYMMRSAHLIKDQGPRLDDVEVQY